MFRVGCLLMILTGGVGFLIMFFSADLLAGFMIDGEGQGITVDEISYVIKMISFALLIIPSMSIVRGFFQGHKSMGPTALSQVIEQIIRIGAILIGSYIIIYLLDGTIVKAVGFATFAPFLGGLASYIVLFIYWSKRKSNIYQEVGKQRQTYNLPISLLFKELLGYAGPIVIIGLAIPLYQLIDQFTFQPAMLAIGQGDIWESAYAAVNVYGHKVAIIPMTIATGYSLALLPSLTQSYAQKNNQLFTTQINQALQIVLVLVIPASAGIAILSDEAYGTLYGMDNIGLTGTLLGWYAPVVLLFALYTITSGILQGINNQRFAVLSLLAGLLTKLLLNSQLIHLFGAVGMIIGTGLAAGITVILNMWRIKVIVDFRFKETFKRTILIIIFTVIMSIVVLTAKFFIGIFLPFDEERWATTTMLIIGVGIGISIYLFLSYKSTLLERIFVPKTNQ